MCDVWAAIWKILDEIKRNHTFKTFYLLTRTFFLWFVTFRFQSCEQL